jgi:hypothetical protein
MSHEKISRTLAILKAVAAATSIHKHFFLYNIAASLCSNTFATENMRLRTKTLVVDSRAVMKSVPLGVLATPKMYLGKESVQVKLRLGL